MSGEEKYPNIFEAMEIVFGKPDEYFLLANYYFCAIWKFNSIQTMVDWMKNHLKNLVFNREKVKKLISQSKG